MRYPRVVQFLSYVGTGLVIALETLTAVARLPYFRIYRKNTLEPALSFCQEQDESKLPDLVERWRRVKKSELEYVQVAVCLSCALQLKFQMNLLTGRVPRAL